MKNCFIFLVVCLTCFWSSYGSADYVKDQILKYCKKFMFEVSGEDSQAFRYVFYTQGGLIWRCGVTSGKYVGGKGKTQFRNIHIRGKSIERSDPENQNVYNEMLSIHTHNHVIGVGAINYTHTALLSGKKTQNIMYIAVTGFGHSYVCEG